jgi:hypothetical protein
MSVTIVNDYFFKPDGDVSEGKAAASDLVDYFMEEVPEVELSLWLQSEENALHHYHITVFSTADVIQKVRDSEAIKAFVERLYPHIDHSTFVSPVCDVWLADGSGVKSVS